MLAMQNQYIVADRIRDLHAEARMARLAREAKAGGRDAYHAGHTFHSPVRLAVDGITKVIDAFKATLVHRVAGIGAH